MQYGKFRICNSPPKKTRRAIRPAWFFISYRRQIYMGLVSMPDSSPRNFQGERPVASDPVS
jgi:hypothetical protein